MTALDILFWLLIALLGGIAWAIEAGLTQRHRKVLTASTLSAFGAALFIMFWIDDNSVLVLPERMDTIKKKPAGERGGFNYEESDEKGGGKKDQPKAGAASTGKDKVVNAAADAKGTDNKDAKGITVNPAEEDDGSLEYTREPFRDCPNCPEMVIVPRGTFSFAAPSTPGAGRSAPVLVPINKAYAIGRVEVLRSEFQAFVADTKYQSLTQCDIGSKRRGAFNWQNPAFEQDGRHPVVCLSWLDAITYVDWINARTKRSYHVPTEIEWEYAARGKTTTPYWQGQTVLGSQANVARTRDGTVPGGIFLMNPFGLADVTGNAWELTSSCWPDLSSTVECARRIIKGGGWNSPAQMATHAARGEFADGSATNFVGLRIAREVDERDADKLLTPAQRKAIREADKRAAEIEAKEREDAEKAAFDARETAAKEAVDAAKAAADKAKDKADKKKPK